MITFPGATIVNRTLPKEAFYKRLTLNNELKEKFISDVKHITLQNSLTAQTLHLASGGAVSEILVLVVELKKREFDPRILESIARQNPHKLVFLLRYGDGAQLTLYHGKLYTTSWQEPSQLALSARGLNLDAVWDSFLEQIVLAEETNPPAGLSVDKRIKRHELLQRLQKELDKTEKLTWAEKQPKKKFEMYQQVQILKAQMEEIINGQAENA
ncbi:DUF4391 domain-containing protein [Oscillibacter sp.]|uniref:DUF4391 domain-containing protein n=1 Tax=Oscillibacter sp. TaxID=1945593 RepID=UPI00289E0295|nr:DUF4391 domain-containing protein [Oscillibacter sp.]